VFVPKLLRDVPVQPTRRDFLKITTAGGVAAAVFGFDLQPAYAELRELKIARASETRSTCPYCSVSCGVIIYTIGDRAKNVTPQVAPFAPKAHRSSRIF
jgi:formate dehydrogenase major subunit